MAMGSNRPPEAQPFGAKMRELRIAAGLTQEELAGRTGLSVRGISDLERGARSRPHFETVRLLADALELAPSDRAALLASARHAAATAPPDATPQVTVISSLPIPATRLVGREQEIEEAVGLLDHGETRLLTLTGPGGVGKTRLALEVASRSVNAEGAVFVDLAAINDPDLVASSVVRALGLRDPGDQSPIELLKEALRNSQTLLFLDNFEHVVSASSLVSDLLITCPKLKFLVTSRTPLHLRGEQEFPVSPLSLPDPRQQLPLAELEQSPAVTLFVQRAQDADPHFTLDEASAPSVVEACQRLDGLPLAIELAAARVKLLPPQVLVGLLERRLSVLTSGPRDAPARHQTMRATIAWSYDLLSPEAQTLFRRIAVFAGGCTLEAIEAVCADDLTDVLEQLSDLADLGLVQRMENHNGAPRFRMQEVVHEFARERLDESGESVALHRAHAAYYLEFSERAGAELIGPHQGAWMTSLTAEEANLDTALEFAIKQEDANTALRMGSSLWPFWARRGHLWEGRMWLERALSIDDHAPSHVRGRALQRLGNLAIDLAEFTRAQALFQASEDLYQELGDDYGVADARNGLGLVAGYLGDYDAARALHEPNVATCQALGDRQFEAIVLHNLGNIAIALGRNDEARSLHQAALSIQQEIGDAGGIAYSTLSLAETTCNSGDLATAQSMFEQCLVQFEDVGDQLGVAYALYFLGRVASLQQEDFLAAERFLEALALRSKFGDRRGIVECIEGIAGVALAVGATEHSARLFSAAAAARIALGAPIPPVYRSALDANVETLRSTLGDTVFTNAWNAGQITSIDQAAPQAAELVATLATPEG